MKTLPNDISRCANANCPLKNDCLRWTDKGNGLVWYSHFEPENGKCENQIRGNKCEVSRTDYLR